VKRHLLFSIALPLLVAVWGTGCGGGPTAIAPQYEPTTAQAQSAESGVIRGTEDAGADVPTPESQRDEPVTAQAQSAETRVAGEMVDEGTSVPTPTAESQIEAATMTPAPTSEPTKVELPAGAKQVIQLVQKDLAQRLGLASEAIWLVSVEAVEWSDTSLGCPQPGMMYAQVIPGFRVVLGAEGKRYEYHTDTGRFVVLCGEEGLPIYPLIPVDPDEIQDGKPWMSNHR
jgi:hypothetical protein